MIFKKNRTASRTIKGYALTDRGCVRPNNEDAIGIHINQIDQWEAMAVVADGMGGHAAGEIASETAVATVQDAYCQSLTESPAALLDACQQANLAVWKKSQNEEAQRGMGCTFSAMVFQNQKMFFAHIGDSRIYLLRRKQLIQLSEDHTLAALQQSEKGASLPNQDHILTRALGISEQVEFQISGSRLVRPGDKYLLCSDGLYTHVSDQEITEIVAMSGTKLPADILMALAKHRGGSDNISVVILQIH